jgi:two-component system, LytTR family, response regulator
MKLRCLAIDDEPLALELLEDNISQIPFLELVGSCRNVFELIDTLKEQPADVLFMDIQMPGVSGIQFMKSLQMAAPPMVVFVTAYEQYAIEGFELNVVDYLLKPVAFERFLKSANRVLEEYRLHETTQTGVILPASDHFFVNANYSLVKIRFDEILYIEGLKDYIKIFTTTTKYPIVTRMTLKNVEQRLPSGQFMRVHKSYIVSFDKIESVRNLKITIGEVHIPIGEQYVEDFMKVVSGDS